MEQPHLDFRVLKSEMERDYGRLVEELQSLSHPPFLTVHSVGEVGGRSIYCCRLQGRSSACRRILLSAGTHGDEPAGPAAVLRFLQRDHSRLLEHYHFLVLPCINPHGYVHGVRENGEGRDINRSFAMESTPEAELVKELLGEERFDLLIDFHEDWEHSGYYLWEGRCGGLPGLGPEIVREIREIGPIFGESTLDGFPIESGIVSAEQAAREYESKGVMSLLTYVYSGRANHGITSETPTQWRMEDRVRAHLAVLDVALRHYGPEISG